MDCDHRAALVGTRVLRDEEVSVAPEPLDEIDKALLPPHKRALRPGTVGDEFHPGCSGQDAQGSRRSIRYRSLNIEYSVEPPEAAHETVKTALGLSLNRLWSLRGRGRIRLALNEACVDAASDSGR